ncbi:hypothetical protein GS493_10780 [Rhodococcus hoagii]|nr:hypothetical protein [Prescottella equi]
MAPAPTLAPKPVESATVYKNCDAVRGAGAAALYAGKPGYSFKRDRDRDACE